MSDDFEDDVRGFMGEMREFKLTTERRLSEQRAGIDMINAKAAAIDVINTRLSNPTVCPAHAGILELLKESSLNDKALEDRMVEEEKKTQLIEYRLTPTQALQLNAASIGTILIAIWEVVKYLFHISI